jgi:hypothetical protein
MKTSHNLSTSFPAACDVSVTVGRVTAKRDIEWRDCQSGIIGDGGLTLALMSAMAVRLRQFLDAPGF